MRLYVSLTSPFARKCRVVVREKGLADRVEEVVVDPYATPPELVAANPVTQIPALMDDEGRAWIDSPLICAWLDSLSDQGPRLVPAAGEAHWRVRRTETLADAALEAGVRWLLETRRPENEQSQSWIRRWRDGVLRGLDALEADPPAADPLDMGAVATVCALTWLDFRHKTLDWRPGRPRLQALQAAVEARPSFAETAPR